MADLKNKKMMMRRLCETHPLYGLAGLVYPPEQVNFVPYNDKDLFERVENPEWYVSISVVINNEEFEYLILDHNELLVVIMKYMEPANIRFLKLMEISGSNTSINSAIIYQGLVALMDIYDFKLTNKFNDWTFYLTFKTIV